MPLFLDQHDTIDEESGEVITCFAEHCGQVLLSDQPLPGSKKARTLVSYEDYWLPGWETDDDGDPVDPKDVDREEVKKFVINPFKTTKQDLEEQFGKRYMFVAATWGEGAPEGKSGMMKGTGHAFFTGGDGLKKRGLVVEEAPKKKKSAAAAAANDGDENGSEGNEGNADEAKEAKEALEAAEARVTELEEQMETMRAEMKEAFAPKPQESMASQFKEVASVFGTFGNMSGGNVNAQAAARSEQFWQEQIAAARKEVSDRERFWNEEVARIRSTANNEVSAKVMSYETRLQTLFSELSAARTASITELAAVHQAQRDDLNRRETAHDAAVAAVKAQLSKAEGQLSDFRQTTDTRISELTATLSAHKLLEMQAGIYKNIETEKTVRIEKEYADLKAERDHFKTLNAEQAETIDTMRRNLNTPTHSSDGESSGFTIPRSVWKFVIPALPMIAALLYKFFAESGKPMPKEAVDWFTRQAGNAGAPGADAWAQQNYADAAEQERARKEKEWDDNERERLRREEAERVAAVERTARATAKVEAERVETARAEAIANERREAEKAAAILVEKQAEATRAEAARVEAARIEGARAEAERAEAERAEAARVEAERVAAARVGTTENPIITPPPTEASDSAE